MNLCLKFPVFWAMSCRTGRHFLHRQMLSSKAKFRQKLRLCMTEVKFHIWISLLPTLLWTSFSIFKPSNLIFSYSRMFRSLLKPSVRKKQKLRKMSKTYLYLTVNWIWKKNLYPYSSSF